MNGINTDLNLVDYFIEKCEKEKIISEVFDFFSFDCIERCNVNPNEIDAEIREFEQSGYSDRERLAKIIGIIKSGKDVSKRKEEALLLRLKDYISEHLTADITVEDMASELYISYYYMCHLFKSKTGFSVSTYRNRKRIEKAIKLLVNTDKKIADIAIECGFNTISYFTENFTKFAGTSPTSFRGSANGVFMHDFYELEDMITAAKMQSIRFLSEDIADIETSVFERTHVNLPDNKFGFLHEAAIVEFKGVLYASWYNCPKNELQGYTPICGKRSYDGGKTWSDMEILADDKSGKILYCPPVYGVCDGHLYLLMNQMVGPDKIHSMDLYILNEETEKFEFLWSRPIPFKLNTNVVLLPNGKLLLPGRTGELDGFPSTPAVLISDSGKIDAEWRLIKVAPNGDLLGGKKLVHPEMTVVLAEDKLFLFNRNDQSRIPLAYISEDFGESWSQAVTHDIPYVSSKIYGGELADGRHYLICNTDRFNRSKMVVYFTDGEEVLFTKRLVLFDEPDGYAWGGCHYPGAHEADGKLYVIATIGYEGKTRGADLFTVDLKKI